MLPVGVFALLGVGLMHTLASRINLPHAAHFRRIATVLFTVIYLLVAL